VSSELRGGDGPEVEARLDSVVDVRDADALAAACEACRAAGTVVVDTEFERTDTFYPRVALVQLATRETVWLVDPLALEDASALRALLEDVSVLKVLHACSEDIEVFAHWLQAHPRHVLDTQLGAAFLGQRFGIGYGELVRLELDVEVDKQETRSNWLQRPLTAAQRRYACLDVIHLDVIQARMRARLELVGRLEWVLEETRAVVEDVLRRAEAVVDWRALKGAAALGPRALLAAGHLAAWRERTARALDRPRNRVARDEHLLGLAEALPEDVEALRGGLLPHGMVKRWGGELQAAVDAARSAPEDELPEPPGPPLSRTHGAIIKRLRGEARTIAGELGLAEELLARKRLVELWFEVDEEVPGPWRGWRWPLLGERLLALLDRPGARPSS
jgi:ribonuclease D